MELKFSLYGVKITLNIHIKYCEGVEYMGAEMKLDFGRCRIYKLNIMDAMTDNERSFYNLYDKGVTQKKLKEVLKKDFPLPQDVAELFSISKSEAELLMEEKFPKKKLRYFVEREIHKFPKDEIRNIDRKYLYFKYDIDGVEHENISRQIVWFENECVRRCNVGLETVPLLKQIVLLKCGSRLMDGILEQIIEKGINIDGKHYIFYTSSTGQMKEQEITLLEEKFWNENKYSLMCGLTEDRINEKGGINSGKYFAARALNISNSIVYDADISIDDVIVVPDFKTMVTGMVNYLDIATLLTEEKEMQIPIEHMDGAGVFIPGTLPCSCQIRGGWLKGAVFPFDFHKFIDKYMNDLSELHLHDAWGESVSIDEFRRAKMIVTDSQLKLRKYYNSMDEYRECFKKAGLSITINNCAHAPGDEVKVAYQAFQTIPKENINNITIEQLTKKSVDYINMAKDDSKYALRLLGIDLTEEDTETKSEKIINPLYECIKRYPDMINDVHVRKIMKSALLAERKRAQGSKLIMDGMWSYICPDLFAFCEWLFLGKDNPKGLVPEGYIYNHYYDNMIDVESVCCLRYPHLSDCEHGVRNVLHSEECEEWFIGNDTIVSCHDLISKVLQADWDGDHICNVHDKAFLNVLNHNTYPLYYKMKKAQSEIITNENKLKCLLRSFENENIGNVSNAITKIFSEKKPDIKLVRILCAYNNFVIDYFKTQKSMDLKQYKDKYEWYKNDECKLPNFFKYAKDKKNSSCKKLNDSDSNADKIGKYIEESTDKKITTTIYDEDSDLFYPEKLENRMIKVDKNNKAYGKLLELIRELKQEKLSLYKKILNRMNMDEKISAKNLFYYHCAYKIEQIIPNRQVAANYLLDIEYLQPENEKDKKDILWNCYGDVLYSNLLANEKNANLEYSSKRRMHYVPSKKRQEEIEQIRKDVIEENAKINNIKVPQNVYHKIMEIKTRRDCVNDKYLLFIIYVLIKRAINAYGEKNDYIRIYKNKRNRKCTRATLDGWLEAQCSDKGLKRLAKKGYIKVEEFKNYTKVWFTIDCDEEDKEVFVIAEHKNPLISLFKKTEERCVKQCACCKNDFLAHGNEKTCSPECSKKLKKLNK